MRTAVWPSQTWRGSLFPHAVSPRLKTTPKLVCYCRDARTRAKQSGDKLSRARDTPCLRRGVGCREPTRGARGERACVNSSRAQVRTRDPLDAFVVVEMYLRLRVLLLTIKVRCKDTHRP